jgi:uncharacterized membrane protein
MNIPPVHPAFVHFPLALMTLSFIADFIGRLTRRESLRSAGWWCLVGTVAGGAIAFGLGYWDMLRVPIEHSAHEYVDFHFNVGIGLVAVLVVMVFWRGVLQYRQPAGPGAPYLISSFLVMLLVLFQGWLGGELVYSYGVGVAPTGQSTLNPEEARSHLTSFEKYVGKIELETEEHGAPGKAHEHKDTHDDEDSHEETR